MSNRFVGRGLAWGFVLIVAGLPRASGQAPTIEESGILLKGAQPLDAGLDELAARGDAGLERDHVWDAAGRDDMILGRVGLGAPRVPTSITTPGGVYQGPRRARGIAAPQPAPIPPPLRYGTMELPKEEDEGPRGRIDD